MADNVKQHVVPRFYISFFHAEQNDTKVWVRVKGAQSASLKSPKGQGYELDAFTVFNGNERDTSCDEANKSIEDWCAPRLAGLNATSVTTNEQWQAVFCITANLLCRSRRTRDTNLLQIEKAQKVLSKFLDIPKEKRQIPKALGDFGLSTEMVDGFPSELERGAKLPFPLTAALGNVPVAEELKTGKSCDLLIAPAGSAFISSDDPPLILEGGQPVGLKLAPNFLSQPEVEIFMPLKPTIACFWSSKSSLLKRSTSAEEVAGYNRLIWENCYERVFANRRADLEHF